MKKVMQQFIDVWKLDFLARFIVKDYRNTKATITFWIVSQTMIAFLMCFQVAWFFWTAKDDLLYMIDTHIPQGASMQIENGQLAIDNVPMPFFREINAQNNGSTNESVAIIIDMQGQAYSLNSLDEYSGGVIFVNDRVYFKDGAELDQMLYTDVPNFSITKDQLISFVEEKYIFPIATMMVIVIMITLSVGFVVFRAIMALWWALMLYILALIFEVRIEYAVAYRAVLHMYIIPAIAIFLVGLTQVSVPYLPSILFLVIFIGNLIWIRNNRQEQEETATVESDVASDTPEVEAVDGSKKES